MGKGQVVFYFQEALLDELNDDFGNWYLVKNLHPDFYSPVTFSAIQVTVPYNLRPWLDLIEKLQHPGQDPSQLGDWMVRDPY